MRLAAAFLLGILAALYVIHRSLGGRSVPAIVPAWVHEEEALPPMPTYDVWLARVMDGRAN